MNLLILHQHACRPYCIAICLLSSLSCWASVASDGARAEGPWKVVAVPDVWKRPPQEIASRGQGYAWFRCRMVVPKGWQGQELELFAEAADDARELYVNGKKIASMGTFPPRYRSGLGQAQRFAIAAGIVQAGQETVVAIRLYQQESRTNFNVAAPVVFSGKQAIRLQGQWEFHAGDMPPESVVRGLTVAAFSQPEDAETVARTLKKLEGEQGPLPAAEALKRFQVPDDLALELPIAEPAVRQPLSVKFDERGRLWVVQYLQYPNPAGLKMVSRDKHLRAVYDKVPPPPPHHFRGNDKITIHEDTDGDGIFDKHTTFVEGLSLVSSFARGRGGVWVLNPPYLLFYPDRDNDDRPDGDPEVHLEGFGLEDSHSIANNLRWGPDGWLYAAQGSTVSGNIKRPGLDKQAIHSMGQLIWRYHPERRQYEVFAEGGGNAFGVEFDSKGRVFSGHNGGDTRGFHYVQGGYYRKGFGKHGELSNPYTFGFFEFMPHHSVPRFTHTFVIYEGGALPKQYQGKLFGVAPLLSHVVYSDIQPDRSSFKTHDRGHPLTTTDPWFRPVDIQVGPDGSIYVADFYEQRIDHASHYQGRIHRASGRIYRLRAKHGSPPPQPFNLAQRSSRDLVALLSHHNKWYRQTALRLLADRRDKSIVPTLSRLLDQETGQLALEALWALHLSGGLDEAAAVRALDHAEPYVRLWTVRLLCDRQQVSEAMAERLIDMAYRETDLHARCQLACSARRLPAKDALPIIRNLLWHSEDAGDVHLPLLLWWAIESKAASDRDAVLALLSDKSIWEWPILREHILERVMRRYAVGNRQDLTICAKLLQLAPDRDSAERLLRGFEQAFEGRSLTALPPELAREIARIGGGSLALQLRQGNSEATAQALQLVADEKAKPDQRIQFIQILAQIDQPSCVPVLLSIVEQSRSDAVRSAALNALQAYDDQRIAEIVIALHSELPEDVRSVAQTLLSSRKAWALSYLQAVDRGRIPKETVPLTVVRRILLHQDREITALVEGQWGAVEGETTAEMRAMIARLKEIIQDGSGNPYSGKRLFADTCGKCHALFKQGGNIGPDLTAYKRDDVQNMLLNVVNPSIEIREGFENYVVFTEDGRTLSGFIADQDNQVVVLRGADGQNTVVPREEIEDMRAIARSVMPDGILTPFSDQQVRDLFAYLRASQPLP